MVLSKTKCYLQNVFRTFLLALLSFSKNTSKRLEQGLRKIECLRTGVKCEQPNFNLAGHL